MRVNPLGDRVVLSRIEVEDEWHGMIIIPDAAKEKPQEAEVISIGDDVTLVEPGDRALIGKYTGLDINIEGRDYTIAKQGEILAVIEK